MAPRNTSCFKRRGLQRGYRDCNGCDLSAIRRDRIGSVSRVQSINVVRHVPAQAPNQARHLRTKELTLCSMDGLQPQGMASILSRSGISIAYRYRLHPPVPQRLRESQLICALLFGLPSFFPSWVPVTLGMDTWFLKEEKVLVRPIRSRS